MFVFVRALSAKTGQKPKRQTDRGFFQLNKIKTMGNWKGNQSNRNINLNHREMHANDKGFADLAAKQVSSKESSLWSNAI